MKTFKNKVMSLSLAVGMMAIGLNPLTSVSQNASLSENHLRKITPACDEDGDPLTPSLECPIWQVHVDFKFGGPSISCSTGGSYKCSPS